MNTYDGRSITWNQYPTPTVVHNAEELAAVVEGWDQVADWRSEVVDHDVSADGRRIYMTVNWSGSKSRINGEVMEGEDQNTVHVVDCDKKTEVIYADFGGVLKHMGRSRGAISGRKVSV